MGMNAVEIRANLVACDLDEITLSDIDKCAVFYDVVNA